MADSPDQQLREEVAEAIYNVDPHWLAREPGYDSGEGTDVERGEYLSWTDLDEELQDMHRDWADAALAVVAGHQPKPKPYEAIGPAPEHDDGTNQGEAHRTPDHQPTTELRVTDEAVEAAAGSYAKSHGWTIQDAEDFPSGARIARAYRAEARAALEAALPFLGGRVDA